MAVGLGEGRDEGATPLDAEELDDLLPTHVCTRAELNAWEQANIVAALPWLDSRRRLLDVPVVRELHRRMFGRTWRWAGAYRRSDKNIGVPWQQVPMAVQQLLDDAAWWTEHHTWPPDEIAARFHHRLVAIHPFPNGNGRHARLLADRLLVSLGRPVFSWGSDSLDAVGTARRRYLAALRAADAGDLAPLLDFVRS